MDRIILLEQSKEIMEGRVRVRSLLCIFMVMGVLVGHSAASFQECYGACFILCAIIPTNSLFTCAVKCFRDCIVPTSPLGLQNDTQYFCKLGCASSICTNLSTKQDPCKEKVGECVNSCSKTCAER